MGILEPVLVQSSTMYHSSPTQSAKHRDLRMKVPLTLLLFLLVLSFEVDGFSLPGASETVGTIIDLQVRHTRSLMDERPSHNCEAIPPHLCAVAYDSGTCRSSGWILPIAEGTIQFRFWSSWWKYRNDMDLVAVRNGCVFTGFSGSDYNGDMITIRAQGRDRWVVFRSSSQYYHMAEDIESLQCYCNNPGTIIQT